MISRNFALGLVIALSIGAYWLIAALMSIVSFGESRLPSVMLRVGVSVLAVVVLWLNRKSLRSYHPLFLGCFGVFWTLLLYRLISDAFLLQLPTPFPPTELVAMVLLFVLIPAAPMFAGLNPWSSRWGFLLLSAITATALLFILLQLGEIAAILQAQGAIRFQLERLNPISMANTGGTMLLLSAVAVFSTSRAFGPMTRLLFLGAGAAGLFVMVLGASRGPLIAAFVALLVYSLIPLKPVRVVAGLTCFAGIAVAVEAVRRVVLRLYEFDVYTRILDAAEGYDGSTDVRQSSFAGAWQQFLDNPWLGDTITEQSSGSYPHNLILEALMATGVLGGLAFIAMSAMMLVAALRLLHREDGYEWIALLAIFAWVGGMFSGTHFGSGMMWGTMVAVVVTERKLRASAQVAKVMRHHRAMEESEAQLQASAGPRNLAEKSLMPSKAANG